MPDFYEFFAGGGMARAGLGGGWRCKFANDFDAMKANVYRENWGGEDFLLKDINEVITSDLPGFVDLAWASFPCQDLSLAGNYAGIGHWADQEQTRSGTFWAFIRLIQGLRDERRAPSVIALENVYGALTANGGRDFVAIVSALSRAGYRFGAMVVDAALFLPHSRPRLFIIAVRSDLTIPNELKLVEADPLWHPPTMVDALGLLSAEDREKWVWWRLPRPPARMSRFADLIQEAPELVSWHSHSETTSLLQLMNNRHFTKVETAKTAGKRMVGGVYKRTRVENGNKVQRAEVRFDDISGCIRTPAGGSSRQSLVVVDGTQVRSRLLSPREAARLMGLPDTFKLPNNYTDAYHVCGDGVALPVVRHLSAHIFEPLVAANQSSTTLLAAE
jgi:DNA (cytosine-5)-methyltransferase 1